MAVAPLRGGRFAAAPFEARVESFATTWPFDAITARPSILTSSFRIARARWRDELSRFNSAASNDRPRSSYRLESPADFGPMPVASQINETLVSWTILRRLLSLRSASGSDHLRTADRGRRDSALGGKPKSTPRIAYKLGNPRVEERLDGSRGHATGHILSHPKGFTNPDDNPVDCLHQVTLKY